LASRDSALRILTTKDGIPTRSNFARPEPWWEPDEWENLMDGRLGPWAIGLKIEQVVAVCHTPVASTSAAEAGVWTHPEHRGQGIAAVVTAAWAEVAQVVFEKLFYSTDLGNVGSQAVAQKLALEPIGTIWQCHP
jgi:RimJ/RimL family protein N-acetyltransferase